MKGLAQYARNFEVLLGLYSGFVGFVLFSFLGIMPWFFGTGKGAGSWPILIFLGFFLMMGGFGTALASNYWRWLLVVADACLIYMASQFVGKWSANILFEPLGIALLTLPGVSIIGLPICCLLNRD